MLSDRDEFYKNTFARILNQLDPDANIETHIIDRIKSTEKRDTRNLHSILLDLSRQISNTVFDAWSRILGYPPTNQEVVIQHGSDADSAAYLELKIKSADGYFDLAERSVGFRWFFMFLLMTSFHEETGPTQKPLFLFDEPASNLHTSAQVELLKSFGSLTERCHLVYSTHSHHMIDLRWLDHSYVISNAALGNLDFKSYVMSGINSHNSISATRYRHFVAQHPTKLSYVQPVLDLLDYRPSTLEPIPNVVMMEGKIDFYFFRYFVDVVGLEPSLHIAPGTGAGSLDTLIRLYVAWGKNFIVLLDSDKEGRDQKDRYERLFGPLLNNRLILLGEAVRDEKIREPEQLLSDEDKLRIASAVTPDFTSKQVSKQHLLGALTELYARQQRVTIDEKSLQRIRTILATLYQQLELSD